MRKLKPKRTFRPGDAIYAEVDADRHIRESDPCNKDNCMLSRGFLDFLVKTYGGKASDYKVKSTNHGCSFELQGRKYQTVFDTKTAARIYKYDETFRKTRSKEKARAGIRSFTARIMIEASTAVTKWPAMTTEVKKHLRSLPRKKKGETVYVPKSTGTARQLSM